MPIWLSPSIGLVSLSLAITFFIITRRARLKRPTWSIRSNNLVRGFASRLPGLEVLFRNQKVDTVTVTRIAFWNRGSATIDRNDIAPADPLKIAPQGSTVLLDVKIVQTSGESTTFEVNLDGDGKAAYLGFDFLDRDHGAVIQVVHTGTSGTDLSVVGTIKGAGKPQKRQVRGAYLPLPTSIEFDRKIQPKTRRRITLACEIASLFVVVIALSMLILSWINPPQWALAAATWATFRKGHLAFGELLRFIAVSFLYGASLVLAVRGRILRPMLPSGLMSLVDDPLQ